MNKLARDSEEDIPCCMFAEDVILAVKTRGPNFKLRSWINTLEIKFLVKYDIQIIYRLSLARYTLE